MICVFKCCTLETARHPSTFKAGVGVVCELQHDCYFPWVNTAGSYSIIKKTLTVRRVVLDIVAATMGRPRDEVAAAAFDNASRLFEFASTHQQ